MKKKLDDCKPSVRKLRKSLNEVQKHQSDVIDKEPVEEEGGNALEKHDDLCNEVSQYLDTLDRQKKKADKFFQDCDDIKIWAPTVEEKILNNQTDSKDPEELRRELKQLDVSN